MPTGKKITEGVFFEISMRIKIPNVLNTLRKLFFKKWWKNSERILRNLEKCNWKCSSIRNCSSNKRFWLQKIPAARFFKILVKNYIFNIFHTCVNHLLKFYKNKLNRFWENWGKTCVSVEFHKWERSAKSVGFQNIPLTRIFKILTGY